MKTSLARLLSALTFLGTSLLPPIDAFWAVAASLALGVQRGLKWFVREVQ